MNRCDYLDPLLPWSGYKDSGKGCSLSRHAFRSVTRLKSYHFKLDPNYDPNAPPPAATTATEDAPDDSAADGVNAIIEGPPTRSSPEVRDCLGWVWIRTTC